MNLFNGNSGRTPDLKYIFSTFIMDYFLHPILSGIYGFTSFFLITLAVKIIMNAAEIGVSITPALLDLQISAVGFILGYGLKVIRNLE